MGHQHEASAWFKGSIDGLGHPLPVGPVVRLAERHQAGDAESKCWDLTRQGLNQPNVDQLCFRGRASGLGEHVSVGIEADGFLDQGGHIDDKDAGTAANVKVAPGAVETTRRGDRVTESCRVGQPGR